MGMAEPKKAILCVDDERLILLALIQELKNSFGNAFVYEKATDADRAFEIIEEFAVEGIKLILIISDWLMPGMKGDEFLETVGRRYPDVKAVMITGRADKDLIKRLLDGACVFDVIEKPWSPQRLVEAVRRCCIDGQDAS